MFLAALFPILFLLCACGFIAVAAWNNQAQLLSQNFALVFTLLAIGTGVPLLSLVLND
jgi:hypothetical protein